MVATKQATKGTNSAKDEEEKLIERIAEEIEAFWDVNEYARWFVLNKRNHVNELVQDHLNDKGFTKEATPVTVDWELEVRDVRPPEFWAEQMLKYDSRLEERYKQIGDRAILEKFESGVQEDFSVRAENLADMDYIIHLLQTRQEWEEHFLPKSVLAEKIEEHWGQDRLDLSVMLKNESQENPFFVELFNERLAEEGFPEGVAMDDVGFEIDVRSKISFERWVVTMFEFSRNADRHRFAHGDAENFYINYPEFLDISIEFTEEPEEFILENPEYNTVD